MSETISTIDIRQRIGDILNRVALRHDEFIIERKGKKLAAIVPIERLEQMRAFARRQALALLDERRSADMTEAEVNNLVTEARRYARKTMRRPATRSKQADAKR